MYLDNFIRKVCSSGNKLPPSDARLFQTFASLSSNTRMCKCDTRKRVGCDVAHRDAKKHEEPPKSWSYVLQIALYNCKTDPSVPFNMQRHTSSYRAGFLRFPVLACPFPRGEATKGPPATSGKVAEGGHHPLKPAFSINSFFLPLFLPVFRGGPHQIQSPL